MLTFIGCQRSGHTADGNLIFTMIGTDAKRYDFAMTPDGFLRLFAMGWQAAAALSSPATSGESPCMDVDMHFAVVNLQPALALTSGPLVLTVPLSKDLVADLRAGIERFGEQGKKRH